MNANLYVKKATCEKELIEKKYKTLLKDLQKVQYSINFKDRKFRKSC